MSFTNKLREQLTQSFVDALNQDRIPWQACWQTPTPENALTGRKYQSTNAFYLSYVAAAHKFMDNRWCTFNQAKSKGWHIQKGAKGYPVEYWAYYDQEKKKMLSWPDAKKLLREDPDYANKNLVLRSKTFLVFNGQQINGIPEKTAHKETNIDNIRKQRDTLLKNMDVKLMEGIADPSYSPISDTIFLPNERDFDDTYSYACTFLHEAGHATGHSSRLNRDLTGGFGSESYAKEELRAEIASAFTAQSLGLYLTNHQLEHHNNLHKSYIQSWASVIKNSPEELFRAIKDAEKISDYLIEKGEFQIAQQMEQTAEIQPKKESDQPLAPADLDRIVTDAVSGPSKTNAPDSYSEYLKKEQEFIRQQKMLNSQKQDKSRSKDKSIPLDL